MYVSVGGVLEAFISIHTAIASPVIQLLKFPVTYFSIKKCHYRSSRYIAYVSLIGSKPVSDLIRLPRVCVAPAVMLQRGRERLVTALV